MTTMIHVRGPRPTICSSPHHQVCRTPRRASQLAPGSRWRLANGIEHLKCPAIRCLGKKQDAGSILESVLENASQTRAQPVADEVWSFQKALILRQMDQMDSERQAWSRREQDLLQEIRALQSMYRDAVRDSYHDVLEGERQRWQQERQFWTEKESSLQAEVASLRSQLLAAVGQINQQQQVQAQQHQQQQQQRAAPFAPSTPRPSASQQVADLVHTFASASSTSSSVSTSFQPPLQQPASTSTVPTSLLGPPQPLPPAPFAVELAAAMAAVDAVDVLQEKELDSFMNKFRTSQKNTQPPPSPPHPSTPPATAASPSSSSQAPSGPAPPTAPPSPPLSRGSGGEEAASGVQSPPPPHHHFIEDASATNRGAAMEKTPFETILAPPNGPPPVLKIGDTDIYWVSRLHSALASHGYYPADEEVEDFCFGSSTEDATATFQASVKLPETGVANAATWKLLLMGTADEGKVEVPGSKVVTDSSNPAWYTLASGEMEPGEGGRDLDLEPKEGEGSGRGEGNGSGGEAESSGAARKVLTQWPVLRDTDGGAEVHGLQVALTQKGYGCDEDERQWWMFGSSTREALIYFQACSGIDETGVCDDPTWKALLGDDAEPSDILTLQDGEYDDDVSRVSKKVWLLGEQRWSTT